MDQQPSSTSRAAADHPTPPDPHQRPAQRPELLHLEDLAQFAAQLDRQLGQCRRYGLRATVLLVTIDPQSDAGDELPTPGILQALLLAIGARLLARVRSSDVVAQVGERRFGLVLMNAGRIEADVVRARLHKALCGPYGVAEQRLYAALRMGAAVYRESGMTGSELVIAAETAQRSADVSAAAAGGRVLVERPTLAVVRP
ncbi:diguanylate cyclase [Roseateles sp. DAIF2]|uniref:diguanylate cyclase domain-containing protein n=1 Tax=Roseateles sp. DAIF2 TaxID=2714952 RepID=UPI0018A26B39|nr:diguanylate cyclase [Roseateles sp. DAIF2]QPF71905.1 diguanylate cyclase [Roseateles sp. DAIF2]